LPSNHPPIYQVYVYGRITGCQRPEWAKIIYLNQLDRYLEQLKHPVTQPSPVPESPVEPTATPDVTQFALIVPNRTLAQRGEPEAIARYLSETLNRMGIAVEVTARFIETPEASTATAQQRNRRLWILCTSPYSPDPNLVAEPIAEQLRDLDLKEFGDALLFCKVTGEEEADWALRVDLTPPEEMLRDWGQWGDVQALTQLLSQALANEGITIASALKESTLHLFCQLTHPKMSAQALDGSPLPELTAPAQQSVVGTVTPLLESIAPQGIHAAAIYGQLNGQDEPVWVNWLSLPASVHPALTETTLQLAQKGDRPALVFLLHRLLNPDLDRRLATGGVRVQVLPKGDLLHIMVDAPVCPQREQTASQIAKYIRQLHLSGVAGVRIYGRRAGQKRPLWSYGADFVRRKRMVPEATPEFAASDAYVGALIVDPGHLTTRPDLTPEDLRTRFAEASQQVLQTAQQWLLRTQVFTSTERGGSLVPAAAVASSKHLFGKNAQLALVWSALGLVLVFSGDRLLGEILRLRAAQSATASVRVDRTSKPAALPPVRVVSPSPSPALPRLSLNKSGQKGGRVFNSSGFTETNSATADPAAISSIQIVNPSLNTGRPLPSTDRPNLSNPDLLAGVRSPYATFNSRQFDQQLALYYRRLAEAGPPDVLIVGSSRALRGVDPTALQTALAAQGHSNISIFNFGINGATVQVVDLLLRKILTPDQLPQMILWADGARAFNSGREDVTYNGILVSPGYRQLSQTGHISPNPTSQAEAKSPSPEKTAIAPDDRSIRETIASNYQAINDFLTQRLSKFSETYPQRQELQGLLRDQIVSLSPHVAQTPEQPRLKRQDKAEATASPTPGDASPLQAVDFDGFMPLSVRYNPATYYQKYARVSGEFDGDYEAFRLAGRQAEALTKLLEFTRQQSIPVVFVNLPLTQDYLDPARSEYEQEYQEFMRKTAIEWQMIFRDLSQLWLTGNDYFSDPSHLNRYGAYEVAYRLAQDPLITWPKSK
ncbi:MAG: hypothetical protein SFW36_13015, partial [Leptolyngbyaceae cyanobacterium bins.59]|nr:hypothetical protein [Leptolyngbyaceae cyanobacterium bins.59]